MNKLLKNKDKNFVVFFKCLSLYQLCNGASLVLMLKEKYGFSNLIPYFYYNPYWKNSLYERYKKKIEEIGIVFIEDEKKYCEIIQNHNKKYFISIKGSFDGFHLRGNFILIDDGIGSYRFNLLKLYRGYLRERRAIGENIKTSFVRFCLRKSYARLSCRLFKPYHYGLFLEGGDKLNLNCEYIDSFNSFLDYLNNKPGANGYGNKIVIFMSQPSVRLGAIEGEEYLGFLKSLEKIVEKNGMSFLIKKHPGDNYDYSLFDCVEDECIAEELIYNLKEKIFGVISFGSNSLINASILFGIKSYTIFRDNKPHQYEKILYKIFNKYTYFVEYETIIRGEYFFV